MATDNHELSKSRSSPALGFKDARIRLVTRRSSTLLRMWTRSRRKLRWPRRKRKTARRRMGVESVREQTATRARWIQNGLVWISDSHGILGHTWAVQVW